MKIKLPTAIHYTFIIITFLLAGNLCPAQLSLSEYRETRSDPYVHVDPQSYKTSPPYFYQNEMIATYQVNVKIVASNKLVLLR